MANILITGASGFIGGFLVEHGLNNGHTIFAAIRKSSNTKHLTDSRINLVELNLGDKQSLKQSWNKIRQQFGKFNYVIHNAGATKVLDKVDFETVNYQYTKNLVESLYEAEMTPDKFIFISSLAAFGPGDENTFSPIKISATPKPITSYGKSKLKAEQFLFQQNKIPFLIFRPTGVYGPRDTGFYQYFKLMNKHIEIYLGNREQIVTFIYIKDLVSLIFKSLPSAVKNRGYFVTDGNNYNIKQFASITKGVLLKKTIRIVVPFFLLKWAAIIWERFAILTNKATLFTTDKYREITQKNWACDSSDTMTDFNFSPKYNLQLGVSETIKWYKENRWL
ncbi:MAG: SDR family NAD(P)-dependent oxidoreductase [Draconibacterium sp.]|nr:SDR family NAD(P)-dependent oxidoreductase [Draconibacterium sp.]